MKGLSVIAGLVGVDSDCFVEEGFRYSFVSFRMILGPFAN